MNSSTRKLLRTIQSEFPILKGVKDVSSLYLRRLFRIAHDRDFRLISWMPDWPDRSYIDIGANRGQSIESILLFRPNADIVAFEPNVRLADRLRYRYRSRQNVRIVPKGLADRPAKFALFVPYYKGCLYDGLASFRREEAESWLNERTVYGFDRTRVRISQVECCAETLDMQKLKPIFIKVDAQGYEPNILAGARETIEQYRPVMLIEGFRNYDETVRLAEDLGYEEYYFDGKVCRRGRSTSSNSFLLPMESIDAYFGKGSPAVVS